MTSPGTDLEIRRPYQPDELWPGLPPDDWAHTFLHTLSDPQPGTLGNTSRAARAAGVTRQAVEKRRGIDIVFNAHVEAITNLITDAVEAAYIRLITNGASRGIYQKGRLMETITEWDTKAMQWWLERKRPEQYHLPTRIEMVQAGANNDTGGFTFRMGDRNLDIEDAEIAELDDPPNIPRNTA